ncbi:MAG: CoA transferase [Chloroflexota bacterium]|nr:CoA transferase [Chloroflexota bacterium]
MPQGALSDLKIIECAQLVSGPFCAKVLADMGAEVIKIEEPGKGDEARRKEPFFQDNPHPERSALFIYLNNSKLGVTLNLRTITGRELLYRLAEKADVLVTNYRPKEAQELGLGYEKLKQMNPRLILTCVTPFGQTGPWRDYAATDLVSFHAGGVGYETPGDVDDPSVETPLKAAGRQADFLAGLAGALATMMAVFGRRLTGQGSLVDVSEQEAVLSILRPTMARYIYEHYVTTRITPLFRQILPTKDGWVSIEGWNEPAWWEQFKKVMGCPEWAENELFRDREGRKQNWDALEFYLKEWTSQRTKEEIARACQSKHVPSFPHYTTDELLNWQQLTARGFWVEIDHPETGKVIYPGPFCRFSETPMQVRSPAPFLGQHNEEVFCGRLGLPREDLARLRGLGIL